MAAITTKTVYQLIEIGYYCEDSYSYIAPTRELAEECIAMLKKEYPREYRIEERSMIVDIEEVN